MSSSSKNSPQNGKGLSRANDESSVILDHSVWSHQTKLSQACLTAMFRICQRIDPNDSERLDLSSSSIKLSPITSPRSNDSSTNSSSKTSYSYCFDFELSRLAYKLLIPKICDILDCFIEDSKKHETLQTALPFYGKQEILHILKLCKSK